MENLLMTLTVRVLEMHWCVSLLLKVIYINFNDWMRETGASLVEIDEAVVISHHL